MALICDTGGVFGLYDADDAPISRLGAGDFGCGGGSRCRTAAPAAVAVVG
jgi:hypothetical protein